METEQLPTQRSPFKYFLLLVIFFQYNFVHLVSINYTFFFFANSLYLQLHGEIMYKIFVINDR